LAFAAELHAVSRSRVKQRVASVLDETALGDVQDTPIAALSHGFRQRVGIAQAIVHEPKLVVLDEPSSGLDPVQIKDMRRLVRGLGGQRTVLVSSHNLPEISETCDRLLVIGGGTIVASGTEAELVARFLSGERLEVSVRPKEGQSEAALVELLRAVPGVQGVELQRSKGSGQDSAALAVSAERDVRGAVARALVEAGHELLGLGRSERELENVFTRLAGGAEKEAA
jgi:ABC-2 type transport system ATP-binding protein